MGRSKRGSGRSYGRSTTSRVLTSGDRIRGSTGLPWAWAADIADLCDAVAYEDDLKKRGWVVKRDGDSKCRDDARSARGPGGDGRGRQGTVERADLERLVKTAERCWRLFARTNPNNINDELDDALAPFRKERDDPPRDPNDTRPLRPHCKG